MHSAHAPTLIEYSAQSKLIIRKIKEELMFGETTGTVRVVLRLEGLCVLIVAGVA